MNSIGKVMRSGLVQGARTLYSAAPTPPVNRVNIVRERSRPLSVSAYNRVSATFPYQNQNSTGSFTSNSNSRSLSERAISTIEESSTSSPEKSQKDSELKKELELSTERELTPAEEEEINSYRENKAFAQARLCVNMQALPFISHNSIDITNSSQIDRSSPGTTSDNILDGVDINNKSSIIKAYEKRGMKIFWG